MTEKVKEYPLSDEVVEMINGHQQAIQNILSVTRAALGVPADFILSPTDGKFVSPVSTNGNTKK